MAKTMFDTLAARLREQENRALLAGISNPREVVFHQILAEAREDVSNQALERADFNVLEMAQLNCTRVLARMAWPGNKKTETKTVVEDPRYPTWKHQLIAELPKGFRRRFLERFFRVNALERKIVTHTFTADTGYIFPETNYAFPDSFGRISFLTDIRVDSEILDALPN